MKLRSLIFAILISGTAFVPAFAHAGEAKIGDLAMTAPDGWKADQETDAKRQDRPTLRLQPATGQDFLVLITPFQVDPSSSIDAAGARNLVASVAATTEPNSVEKKLPVNEFKSETAHGYYFSATDPAPKDGEWKYMTQGIMLVGKLSVGFTIFSNSKDSPAPAQALAMLRGAHSP